MSVKIVEKIGLVDDCDHETPALNTNCLNVFNMHTDDWAASKSKRNQGEGYLSTNIPKVAIYGSAW